MMSALLGDRKKGLLFIVSAPAGAGKTTLVKKLTEEFPNVIASISYTTRQPRSNEVCGKDYHFVTAEEFQEKILADDFLEFVALHGIYYGTSKKWVEERLQEGKHVVLVIDTQGAMFLKDKVKATYIFILPPSIEILKQRLLNRATERNDVIKKRLEWAQMELQMAHHYDYQVVNDELDVAYEVLKSILIAECHRSFKLYSS